MKIEGGEERERRRKGGCDAEKRKNGMPRRNRGVPALKSNVACVAVRSSPWEPRLGLACAVGLVGLGSGARRRTKESGFQTAFQDASAGFAGSRVTGWAPCCSEIVR